MDRRWVAGAIVIGAVLTGACGGEGSGGAGPTPSATATPTPQVYSDDQLAAALPAVDDVPGAVEVTATCPGDDPSCENLEGGVQVELELSLSGGDDADAERDLAASGLPAFAFVGALTNADDAETTTRLDAFTDTQREYDGSYTIEPTVEDGIREEGTGEVETVEIGPWTGVVGSRVGTFSGSDFAPQQTTQLRVVLGRTEVSVSIGDRPDEEDPRAGTDLAIRLATEYVERLG